MRLVLLKQEWRNWKEIWVEQLISFVLVFKVAFLPSLLCSWDNYVKFILFLIKILIIKQKIYQDHNGFDSIPALYLVEYSSEKAFFNKFESMKDFFQSCSSLDILPPCKLYPWAEEKVE